MPLQEGTSLIFTGWKLIYQGIDDEPLGCGLPIRNGGSWHFVELDVTQYQNRTSISSYPNINYFM
ncbi:hypothetical protein AHMF7616_01978 [Adhaeribacter pallidiroseus]|uniref:Uncharacterized protein n=1 Tax=Adhaeribacter pallidiroseus TaxID=2072847 RepID=A0A369QIF6_9BACT|nr:hypothetical protein AHMF7616_01978 [Adhaeribacter pallidiroseus]